MAYFEPQIYRAVNAGPLRFNIMKFCCVAKSSIDLVVVYWRERERDEHWWSCWCQL